MQNPPRKHLVLVGGGHAHVHVLDAFGRNPEAGAAVTLVTRDLATPYSGMLPGHIAGAYNHGECHIDLRSLAAWTGTQLVHGEVCGIDLEQRRLMLLAGDTIPFDIVSLDIGSTPEMDVPGAREHAVPVKPIAPFLDHWRALVEAVEGGGTVPRIAIVGGGAGGVESALAMHARLRAALDASGRPGAAIPLTIVTAHGLVPSFSKIARWLLKRELRRRRIAVVENAMVSSVEASGLLAGDGRRVAFDELFWMTWAGAPDWLRGTGLDLDERGFVAVDDTLRSTSHPVVFAAGDVAAVLPYPRPKAGVFAVRQGPPLERNLRLALNGREPLPFRPQPRALSLVGTGDGEAVADCGPLAVKGRLVWRLKEWIDRRWMRRYGA